MKKRSRLKSIARWTAWVLAVLLPLMWVAGLFGSVRVRTPRFSGGHFMWLAIGKGCLALGHTLDPSKDGASYPIVETQEAEAIRIPSIRAPDIVRSRMGVQVVVPLWLPWLFAMGISILLFRDHFREKRERRLGCCPACGYSRAGLAPDAPCPECGTLPKPGAAG